MPLTIHSKDDLKNMVGYHIDAVEVVAQGALRLMLSHISEPGVKYQVLIIPQVQPSINGNLLVIDRGLTVTSTGIVSY